jgi:hypothetical protein
MEKEMLIEDMVNGGVFAISLVELPAMEESFIMLSEEVIELKIIDESKRTVLGIAMTPEKRIPRRIKNKDTGLTEEVKIFFSEDTIELTSQLFLKNLNTNEVTVDHKRKIEGATIVESWIVENPEMDKSNIYNLGAIKGAWVVKMKIYNDQIWSEIEKGTYKGFSIEGRYGMTAELSEDEQTLAKLVSLLSENETK